MALPMPPNTTCDVYRSGSSPPAAPDVAGLRLLLLAAFDRRVEQGEGYATSYRYTHVALAELDADIRDGDTLYVPDPNGTPFLVVFVERSSWGSPQDHRRVYVDRLQPTWPTNEL
jgi:hypothetical protein